MTRLTLILFSVISTSLMGAFIVAVLVTGYDTMMPIIWAAVVGFVLAMPASWLVAKQITE
ncbi:CTP synthetase [Pseudorhodobacter sp.]|uniref:CTP synthetase n=1 Tax=Pseudorhodobacter sp. TaxID=1934400 RepID=UPI00264893C7|nr:CTP synthetase [Pseudorhodobacter sp.]MDN5786275.1 CTP synthetase [Pseudorhodobacter sp.]